MRKGGLAAIAAVTLVLPPLGVFLALIRFVPAAEAWSVFPLAMSSLSSAVALACPILVLLCAKPRRLVAVLLGLLAVVYAFQTVAGPYPLASVLLWLYVAIVTFRAARAG